MARQVRLWLQGLAIGFAIIGFWLLMGITIAWRTSDVYDARDGEPSIRGTSLLFLVHVYMVMTAVAIIAWSWVDDARQQRRWIVLRAADRLGLPRRVWIGIGIWILLSTVVSPLMDDLWVAFRIVELLAIGAAVTWARLQPGHVPSRSRWERWSSQTIESNVTRRDVVLFWTAVNVAFLVEPLWRYGLHTVLVASIVLCWRRVRQWKAAQRIDESRS